MYVCIVHIRTPCQNYMSSMPKLPSWIRFGNRSRDQGMMSCLTYISPLVREENWASPSWFRQEGRREWPDNAGVMHELYSLHIIIINMICNGTCNVHTILGANYVLYIYTNRKGKRLSSGLLWYPTLNYLLSTLHTYIHTYRLHMAFVNLKSFRFSQSSLP